MLDEEQQYSGVYLYQCILQVYTTYFCDVYEQLYARHSVNIIYVNSENELRYLTITMLHSISQITHITCWKVFCQLHNDDERDGIDD